MSSAALEAASVPYLNQQQQQQQQQDMNSSDALVASQANDHRPISPDSQLTSTTTDTNYDSLTTNASDGNLSPSSLSSVSSPPDSHTDDGAAAQPESLSSASNDSSSSDADHKTTSATATRKQSYPCSAVHALDRDMPDYDYAPMVLELRKLILDNIQANPGLYGQREVLKCKQDDWYLARFLLRHKMDMTEAFEQLKRTMRYHHESLCTLLRPEDFPAEFYLLGGTFSYQPDRRGNVTMYMRVKVHRKTPEIKAVVESFLYYNLLQTDELAKGRGITLVMDCTGGGLPSADLELLFFFVSNLRNYFPKGLSYILVHNLPWLLKPFWHLAKNWVPDEHRELIKFSNNKTIFEFIDEENLPDFMGGTCERNYRQPPENCTNLREAIKFWGIDLKVARSILAKFSENLPKETVDNMEREFDELEELIAEKKATDENGGDFPDTPNILKTRINSD